MRRRLLLKLAALIPLLTWPFHVTGSSGQTNAKRALLRARVRPSDPGWPTSAQWARLDRDVEGRLLKPVSPFLDCSESAGHSECATALQGVHNPYFIGDEPALTQASGWVDAWTCESSAYAVAAEGTADVVAAVNFARTNNPSPGGQRRGTWLPRYVQCTGFATDLDASDECRHVAR